MSPMRLQEASDLKELAEFAKAIWLEYWKPLLPEGQTEYMIELFHSEKVMKEQIENAHYHYFYLETEEGRIGYTALSVKEDQLFLSKLYVLKEHRHQGFGGKAFELIKEFAKSHALPKITLTVKRTNAPAIDAYLKWGFKITKSIDTDIGSGFVMPDYVMEYTL